MDTVETQEIPSEEITPGPNTSGQNAPSFQPKPDCEPTEDISISQASSQKSLDPIFQLEGEDIQQASSSPKRSIKLEDVIALHTARRMKGPSKSGQKLKQGVSIPSQRRWLYYWSVVLNARLPAWVLGGWRRFVFKRFESQGTVDPARVEGRRGAPKNPPPSNYSSDARAYGHEEGVC